MKRDRIVRGKGIPLEKVVRRLLIALVGGLVSLISVGSQAVASPASHLEFPVVGDTIVCEDATYSIVQGTIRFVIHSDDTPSGNFNFTGTIAPQDVVAVGSDGNFYQIVGAEWFGATGNAKTGGVQETFTGKFQIISQEGGGTVDSVNQTFHVSPNGDVKTFDFGTCVAP